MKSITLGPKWLLFMLCIAYSLQACQAKTSNNTSAISSEQKEEEQEETSEKEIEKPAVEVSQAFKDLEAEYTEMLAPIVSYKQENPELYWFIVSWLKTNYKTPDWTGYYSDEWRISTKQKGIDCSGFTRVMVDQLFDKKVMGGSQGILETYCTPISTAEAKLGDLLFFRAPYSTNDRIVHVGVYLKDQYFVHATSTKSAAKGLGLNVNSLEEENWSKELVTAGRIKS